MSNKYEDLKDVPVPERILKGQAELIEYYDSIEGKKNYSDFPEMSHNPFICLLSDDISLKYVKIGNSGDVETSVSNYFSEATGELIELKSVSGGKAFYERRYVDKDSFTKIYRKNLKEMFSLSSGALKLFGFFMEAIDFKDKDGMVYMSLQDGMDFCEYGENSRSLVYRGLTELIMKGFICKSDRPWTFFVNPKYIHNGDRAAILKEYVIGGSNDHFAELPAGSNQDIKNNENNKG